MKNIVSLLAVFGTVLVCSADYLYWAIGSVDSSISYNYAAIYATTTGKASGGTALTMYTTSGTQVDYVSGTSAYAADISSAYGENYSYYITLLDTSYAEVAYSSILQYGSGSSYMNKNLTDVPSAQVWMGGSYTASPEPSSALLLLLGLAGLGLKRKNA